MKRSYIVYSLSKDRTTQKFNKNKIDDIVAELQTFLGNYTTADILNPASIKLTVYNDGANSQGLLINNVIRHFTYPSEVSPIAYDYPSGVPSTITKKEWVLPGKDLSKAIQFLRSQSPLPKFDYGPLEILISYDFKLIYPVNKKELHNHEHTSYFLIWFSRGRSISPTLFFPFETPNENFWNYLDNIVNVLPFKLEEKYLRIANVNSNGEVKSFKKIIRPIQ